MKTSVLFAVALLGVRAAAAERVTCPVRADAQVYATPWNSGTPEDSEALDN
jgi:hypothetical protein